MEFETLRFPGGLRVVLQQVDSPISHACVLVGAGSRDEEVSCYGLAHFIEHLLFKRTERRTTSQILNRLESVGADLNAYTTKEYTCLHASFLTPYLERTLDLFEDLLFHSIFPQEELEKERGVILDEIASYQDSPEDAVMDDFEDIVFAGHGLGHNILGTERDICSLDKAAVLKFMGDHYRASGIVIGISGHYSLKMINRVIQKIFGTVLELSELSEIPDLPAANTRSNGIFSSAVTVDGPATGKTISLAPVHVERQRPINQVHYVLGGPAYSIHHDRKTGLMLLNNLLGGMGMSSRLNMSIREKHGIAYTIESGYTPFSDTGLFTVYFGTDADKYQKAVQLVFKEFRKLREQPLGSGQLHQAKKKFKGQIALGEENRLSLLITQAKSLLDHDRIETLSDVFEKIDRISATELQDIANEILDENRLYALSFLPE